MHYYDSNEDIAKNEISDWESRTPTDPMQAFLKMSVEVFEKETEN